MLTRHAVRRLVLLLAAVLLAGGVASLLGTAAANAAAPSPCQYVVNTSPSGDLTISAMQATWDVPCPHPGPEVSVTVWKATSLSGQPLAAQVREVVLFDGPMPAELDLHVPLTGDCFRQVDFAYGSPPADLSTPYGPRLIQSWHQGTVDCVTAPPTTAPTTTPPVTTPPVTSAPPASSLPATMQPPTPSAPVTTPAVVPSSPPAASTTPAPTTPAVTLVPPTTITKPPVTHKPVKHHAKPRPRKTTEAPRSAPPGNTGCVGSASCIPTPRATPPVKQLPYTGMASTILLTLLGSGLLVTGLGLVTWSWKQRG